MAPKSSNNNTIKNIDSIHVALKLTQDVDRTWVYTDKLWDFSNDYDESQENIH